MLAVATHFTKRGVGARLRIDTISELPDVWR
jgi:maltooligosyltrehalose synthase